MACPGLVLAVHHSRRPLSVLQRGGNPLEP